MDVLILLVLAVLARIPFLAQAGNLLDLDEASFALMAKRILMGEIPLYLTSQSYLGSLVSFVMAPWVALLGCTALPVKLTTLTFSLGFIAVNYLLLKTIARRSVAIFASLFLILMPPGLMDLSTRVTGAHPELWVFQAVLLLLLFKFFEGPTRIPMERLLLGMGVLTGMALWICEVFLLYLIPFLIYFVLRFWKPREESVIQSICNFFRLSYFRLPTWLRILLQTWHGLILLFLVFHGVGIFLPHFGAVVPFQIKVLKKLFLVFSGELVLIYWFHTPASDRLSLLRNLGFLVGGFLLGHAPAIVFNLAGGEGLRIFHGSGAIGLTEIPNRLQLIFMRRIPELILGNPVFWEMILVSFGVLGFAFRKNRASYIWLFYGLGFFILLGNLVSTLEAARYLSHLYVPFTVLLGYFLGGFLWPKRRLIAILLALFVLLHFGHGYYRYYRAIPKDHASNQAKILEFLRSEKIHGGYASRTISSILTYLSKERLIFSSYGIAERYIPYEQYTKSLSRPAYIFETDDSSAESFRKDENLFSQVESQKIFGPYIVYLLRNSSSISDLPYAPPPRRFPIYLYLNE